MNKRRQDCNIAGTVSELNFVESARAMGWGCEKSSSHENRIGKVDFHVSAQNRGFTCDVKASKLNGPFFTETPSKLVGRTFNPLLIEAVGISGHPGWAKQGAEYIAFEVGDCDFWHIVKREQVYGAALAMSGEPPLQYKLEDRGGHQARPYNWYGRYKRKDVFCWIEYIDSWRLCDDFINIKYIRSA